jgi:hypothetical protein
MLKTPVAPQETAFCAAQGCGRRVRRPMGAASLCAAGHEIPSNAGVWESLGGVAARIFFAADITPGNEYVVGDGATVVFSEPGESTYFPKDAPRQGGPC